LRQRACPELVEGKCGARGMSCILSEPEFTELKNWQNKKKGVTLRLSKCGAMGMSCTLSEHDFLDLMN